MNEDNMLWPSGDLPRSPPKLKNTNFESLRFPLWTENKARLIQSYLQLFLYITKHGTYIDGFAGPQYSAHQGAWAAKLALEMKPTWLRNFWLCEIAPRGVQALDELKVQHEKKKRNIHVIAGDFNSTYRTILASGQVTDKEATFALLDQRTFECKWSTVRDLSLHKKSTKIELFYFFASGWIDRSLKAISKPETTKKVEDWWGRPDWQSLLGMDGTVRAQYVAERFEKELGYKKASIFPIHNQRRGGRVMYHMIHATDHKDAPILMVRAYRKTSGRPELSSEDKQMDLEDLLRAIQDPAS